MGIFEIVIMGVGLAMDASTVAMTNGMVEYRIKIKKALFIALTFGIFQGLMPIFGYYSGRLFAEFIDTIDHFIAFGLLGFLGIRMIIESRKKEEVDSNLSYSKILVQGFATSIDALIVGLTFAFQKVYIYLAALIITIVTAILSFISIYIGCKCGSFLKNKAQIFGGIILIGIGFKILIEGL